MSASWFRSTTQRRSCLQLLLGGVFGFVLPKDRGLRAASQGQVQLHMYIRVRPGQAGEFEKRYRSNYVPMVSRQKGFLSARLLREHSSQDRYEIDIAFESEALRATWAGSPDHDTAWKPIDEVIAEIRVQGFDVIG